MPVGEMDAMDAPLLKVLTRLLSSQFEELVFRLGIEPGELPGPAATQRLRAQALLELCRDGGHLAELRAVLGRMGVTVEAGGPGDAH